MVKVECAPNQTEISFVVCYTRVKKDNFVDTVMI